MVHEMSLEWLQISSIFGHIVNPATQKVYSSSRKRGQIRYIFFKDVYSYGLCHRKCQWVHFWQNTSSNNVWEVNFTSRKSSSLLDHSGIFLFTFISICQFRMQSGCDDCNQCSELHVDICWHLEFVKTSDGAGGGDSTALYHRGVHAFNHT